MEDPVTRRIERLKTVKSLFVMEAQSLSDRGLDALARPFYERAAQGEIDLAEHFQSAGRDDDAQISLFSAASCLAKAHQFRSAATILHRLAEIPEAEQLLARCEGRDDEPLMADLPELRALIQLLVNKGLISQEEWSEALRAAEAS